MKIALIGQDIPTLLPTLLTDLLFVGKQSAEVALEEKNAAMQDVLQRYGEAVIRDAQSRHPGLTASISVTGSRCEVLDGADCVIYAGDCMAASRFKMDREALSGVEEDDPGLTGRPASTAASAVCCTRCVRAKWCSTCVRPCRTTAPMRW